LRKAGHVAMNGRPDRFDEQTLLLIWNRYGEDHALATRVEAAGGRVLVAENGYLGIGGSSPKFDVHPNGPQPHHYYALAEGWHNGGGRWRVGPWDRFKALCVNPKPYRNTGDYILVCPNRSFGVQGRMMPIDWTEDTVARLKLNPMGLPVRVRAHPGNFAPKVPLAEDLAGAAAVVIWSSGAGVHALVSGIPVVALAPFWICRTAAFTSIDGGSEMPPDRTQALHYMAWAQWRVDEIESGEAFVSLLRS